MTPPAATILATTAAPLLLSLLGTAVLLGYALRPARRDGRTAWRTLRRLASRPAALLCVCLMALFAQLGGSLDKGNGGSRVSQLPGGSVSGAHKQAPIRSVPVLEQIMTKMSSFHQLAFWAGVAYPDKFMTVYEEGLTNEKDKQYILCALLDHANFSDHGRKCWKRSIESNPSLLHGSG